MRFFKQTVMLLITVFFISGLAITAVWADDPDVSAEDNITLTADGATDNDPEDVDDTEPVEAPEEKWIFQDGFWFYFIGDEAATGWKDISGKRYFFNENGEMLTGWQYIEDEWFFMNDSGAMQKGWLKRGNTWYFLEDSGAMVIGWDKIDGKWYCFDETGKMLTGWQYIEGEWFFMNDSGAMQKGWLKRGNTWYFLEDSGAMVIGWDKIDGKWYCFDETGKMLTGWQYIEGEWFFMNDSGAMQKGWLKRGNTWYFLKDSGAMVIGWDKIAGDWYYFDENGEMAFYEWAEGYWLDKDGVWRYRYTGSWYENSKGWWFGDTSGWYAKNSVAEIDGVMYIFDSNGYLSGTLDNYSVYKKADNALNSSGRDLYSAYKWCVDKLTYTRAGHGSTTSENAEYAYDNKIADCIGFASAFCYMARVLGYDCVVLHGEVPYNSGGFGEHAWCQIIVGGSTYWVDTQFAKQTGRNGYLFNYGQSGTWMYRNWNVMTDF